ncbi:hypothetical protein AB3R30_18995 [Leptolyngbyaceae cyanobacterium UHCC 1019]
MVRYCAGDIVAVKDRFELVGRIVEVDAVGKGYKVDTGKGVVYRYDNEVVSIQGQTSTTSREAISKIDNVGKGVPGFSNVHQPVIDFLKSNTALAQTFAMYVTKIPSDVLASCLEVIKEGGVEVKITININLINIKLG